MTVLKAASFGPKSTHLPLLTEARGVAALLVVHVHLLVWHLPIIRGSWRCATVIVSYGWLAVDFFFVLSGFVLAHVYAGQFSIWPDRVHLRSFFQARFARIYPLHLLASTGFFLLTAGFSGVWSWGPYLHDVFLVNALPKLWPLNIHSWSIGAEAVTYLFAPLMIAFAGRLSKTALFLGLGGSAASLAYLVIGRWGGHDYHSVFRCLPEFFAGVLLYQFYLRHPLRPAAAVIGVSAAIAALFILVSGVLRPPLDSLACLVPIALLVLALPQLPAPLIRKLAVPPLRFLGDISYSVYLLHPLLLLFIPGWKERLHHAGLADSGIEWIVYAAAFALLVAGSWLAYRWLELPCRTLLRPGGVRKN